MIPAIRNIFNSKFTDSKYQQMLADIEKDFPGCIEFRLAETPIFIDSATKNSLLEAGDEICSFITSPHFKETTEASIKHVLTPQNESTLPECIVMDFAICKNEQGQVVPKLIELQGFPSLFGLEVIHDIAFRNNFEIPLGFTPYLNGYDKNKYTTHLSTLIKGKQNKHTILLELKPHEQKTKIDFYYTQQLIDIPIVCLSEVFIHEDNLCYTREGITFKIERIYNRIVWDELNKQPIEMQEKAKLLIDVKGI